MDETKLLQQIRDYLYQMLGQIDTYLSSMATDVADIKANSDSLPDIETAVESADAKLDTTNSHLDYIKINTGAVVTPTANIKLNTDAMKADLAAIASDIDIIESYMNTISTNTGTAASFDEDIATNTLNTYGKVTTIASDTTQMRADMSTIIGILNDIYDKL